MTNQELVRYANELLICTTFETVYKNFDLIKVLGWTKETNVLDVRKGEIFNIFEQLLLANKEKVYNNEDNSQKVESEIATQLKTHKEIIENLVKQFHTNIAHYCGLLDDQYYHVDKKLSILCDFSGAYIEVDTKDISIYSDYEDKAYITSIRRKYCEDEAE